MLDALPFAPATLAFALAVACALLALRQAVVGRRRWRQRRRGNAGVRLLLVALALALALAFAGLGTGLRGYHRLLADAPVAELGVRQLGPQRFAVRLVRAGGGEQRFAVAGDQWQLDARVIRWSVPALLAGAPPLYRLERLSGRYQDIAQEREAERTIHALDTRAFPDLWTLKRQHPGWLPFVEADYGSAAYLPLLDGARYTVALNARGGLVARPADAATSVLLEQAGW